MSCSRTRFAFSVLLVIAATALPAAADYTRNILLTGFWPPTNEMLRPFSQFHNSAGDPNGWVGGNWEGRGYDVYSYFPEFENPQNPGAGTGDFMVDYQKTSADFWHYVNALHPLAIITFGQTPEPYNWRLELSEIKWNPTQWMNDYITPYRPTPELPIYNEPNGNVRYTSLPAEAIINAVWDMVGQTGANVFAWESQGDTSNFLCDFIGYHANWYHDTHASPTSDWWNIAAGHIHVGAQITNGDGWLATQATVRALTGYLDTIIPEPATIALLIGVGLLGRRGMRR